MLSMRLGCLFTLLCYTRLSLALSVGSSQVRHAARQYQENDKLGAVASESAVCSRIGVNLIKSGGNAADAVGFPLGTGES